MKLVDIILKLEEFNINFYLHNKIKIYYIKQEKKLYSTYIIIIYNYDEKTFLKFKESITFNKEFITTINNHIIDLHFNCNNENIEIKFYNS